MAAERESDHLESEDEDVEFEGVELEATNEAQHTTSHAEEEPEQMEEVDVEAAPTDEEEDDDEEDAGDDEEDAFVATAAYADLHGDDEPTGSQPSKSATKSSKKGKGKSKANGGPARIYYDGKGQHAGIEVSLDDQSRMQRKRKAEADAEMERKRKKRESMITPRDRQNRIVAHKLHVLALLAWCKNRNGLLQDEDLQAWLVDQTPKALIDKHRRIHPRKEPNQRERVRLFEAFITQLTEWWRGKFGLDPEMVAASAIRQPDSDLVNGSGISFGAPGFRADGWIYETPADRVERDKREREEMKAWQDHQKTGTIDASSSSKKNKGKRKAAEEPAPQSADGKAKKDPMPTKTFSISIFPPGEASTTKVPAYMRLAEPVEKIRNASDLLDAALEMKGSRETSASLFASLCRALGIPSRLVISPQVPPWSVAAAKISTSGGDAVGDEPVSASKNSTGSSRRGVGGPPIRMKPAEEMTSEEEPSDASTASRRRRKAEQGPQKDIDFFATDGRQTTSPAHRGRAAGATSTSEALTKSAVVRAAKNAMNNPGRQGRESSIISISDDSSSKSKSKSERTPPSARAERLRRNSQPAKEESPLSDLSDGESIVEVTPAKANGRRKRKAKETFTESEDDGKASEKGKGKQRKGKKDKEPIDYREGKWKGLDKPLNVKPTVKLRPHVSRRKPSSHFATDDTGELPPVNLQQPPTVWVEVFSKPFQKWLTVDPVRGFVFATGNRYMEPVTTDRQNKLVYVVAYEEDGYARDVTARYTRTLHSRIAKMRPPASRQYGDWWESVVKAISRPYRLDRDAVEDVELDDNASKEPMPSSVAGFKDHPVYAIEKHIKREEVIFPANRVGTFQNTPVFLRSSVLTCRSARQWMNEGRSIKEGENPLKFVKSRAYTISNKRAAEQAKAEGGELPQEGLYARFQTQVYKPPPVVDGKIPTNSFGNIDLYVPSMLPEGAAHIPFNGSAKIAKKLGIPYAEAVVGFEFRKFKGMPKMGGIVVPIEHEQAVTEAFWESEHAAVEREAKKKEQKALRNWRRLINAVLIAERIDNEYGAKSKLKSKSSGAKTEVRRLRPTEQDVGSVELDLEDSEQEAPGGFFLDGEEPVEEERPRRVNPLHRKYGANSTEPAAEIETNGHRDADDEDMEEVANETSTQKVISLATMIAAEKALRSSH